MKLLNIVWVILVGVVIYFSSMYTRESATFYGIAETKEIVVNTDNPVIIKKIHVVEGQKVKEGDLLVELERPELTMRITQEKSQRQSRLRELRAELQSLRAQYSMNKKLSKGLRSIESEEKSDEIMNPIKIQINNLKREIAQILNASSVARKDTLKNETELLKEEMKKLNIRSEIDGVIGNVNFKRGENVSPFTPILTLHKKSPSYIKGYIHENAYNKVSIGQKVKIHSLTDRKNGIEGEVVGVGSRIIRYPRRLRKRPDIEIWGREVTVKIPEDNNLLLGEKVMIGLVERPEVLNIIEKEMDKDLNRE
ncbi:MAG: HlyD family secretion protein [Chitinivibrionales bacterium]